MKFSDDIVWRVWSKGKIEGGNDPVFWRKDECGAWIFRGHYENQNSEYGWVIDHIKPLVDVNVDDISDLRPVHHKNIMRQANGDIICGVTAESYRNVEHIIDAEKQLA